MPLYLNPNRVFVVEGVPLSERLDPSVYIGSTLGSFLLFACFSIRRRAEGGIYRKCKLRN
jgi:hypothetical protein